MNILWQILQWNAAVIEIFLEYYAIDVFVQKGWVYKNKIYVLLWSMGIGSVLAFNRHWDVGLISWPILILQSILIIISVLKRMSKSKKYAISVVIACNVYSALFQYLFCFFMITWGPCSDVQIVYMNMGIYRVSCYYLSIVVDMILLFALRKRISNQQKIGAFYKTFIIYAGAGGWLFLAMQNQLIGYGRERSAEYTVLLWFVLLASFFALLGNIKEMQVRTQLQVLDTNNKMLERNYREMKRLYQNYAFTFHDMKNHLVVLDQYCRNGEMENAIDYIEKIRGPIMHNYHFIHSGNESLDIIINFKLLEAKQAGIKTEIVVDQINNIKIEDHDLCCIIGNLFDNAIEACEVVERAWISVSIHLVGSILLIHISNSYLDKGERCTNIALKKKALQGYGMQSVKCAVEKYDGLVKWEKKKNVFLVKVTMFDVKEEKYERV